MDKRKRGDGFPFAVVIVFVLLAASIIAFSPLGTAITTLLSKGGETAACSPYMMQRSLAASFSLTRK